MRELKKDLRVVARGLRGLTQKTEKMIRQLEKPAKLSAAGTVRAIIKGSRKGVDKAPSISKTGFTDRGIHTSYVAPLDET